MAETIQVPIQYLGKVRAVLNVSPNASYTEVRKLALAHPRIKELIKRKTVKEVIVADRNQAVIIKTV